MNLPFFFDKTTAHDEVRPMFTYPEDFERFWKFYPRKADKGAAFKVWKRMSAADKSAAIDRAEWVAGCWDALDPDHQRRQYIKYPQGWLSARGWEDGDEEVKLNARGK